MIWFDQSSNNTVLITIEELIENVENYIRTKNNKIASGIIDAMDIVEGIPDCKIKPLLQDRLQSVIDNEPQTLDYFTYAFNKK